MTKTGIFLCRCFGAIDGVVDLDALREKLGKIDSAVTVSVRDSLCLAENISTTASLIRDTGMEKVLIGACSFLSKGEAVVNGLVQEGVERSAIGLVDLRESCAWIHANDPANALLKAYDLIRMEIAALGYRQKSRDVAVRVRPEALVVGGGPAGLSAAAALARLGLRVHLLERGASLGGMLNLISRVYPADEKAQDKIRALTKEIGENELIKVYPKGKITAVAGYAGDFKVRFSSSSGEERIRVGAVILATGARIYLPDGLYGYGKLKNVITQMELERRFVKGDVHAKGAVFIQCVGARNLERPYCATLCCPSSLKNAMRIKDENPDAEVFVLHRDIMMPGRVLEAYYRKALAKGVQFIRYEEARPPQILGDDGVEGVAVHDVITGVTRNLKADLAVLSTPLVPNNDNKHLADRFGVQLDHHGFFKEIYPLHPLETRVEGVFICGSARWPVSSEQAMTQGEGAAVKAASLLGRERVRALSLSRVPGEKLGHASVNEKSCTGCGNCVAACPFDACALQKVGRKFVSRVNKMRCKGCGNCVSACPNGTIQLPEHDYRAVGGMIKYAFSEEARP